MTDSKQQHRATPEQWASIDDPENPFAYEVCILELRDRIAALEAGQTCPHIVTSDEGTSYCALAEQTHSKPTPNDRQIRSSPDHFEQVNKMVTSSLVERVQSAISDVEFPHGTDEARAAIREVAAWIRERGWDLGARALEREAEG
jgi:hypothetical protein